MAEDWAAIAADAKAAIDANGGPMVLTKLTQVQETPWDTASDTTVAHDVIGVDLGIRIERGVGGVVLRETRQVLLSTDVAPAAKDTLTISGKVHVIERVLPLQPAGVAVLYRVELVA